MWAFDSSGNGINLYVAKLAWKTYGTKGIKPLSRVLCEPGIA